MKTLVNKLNQKGIIFFATLILALVFIVATSF
jgi:hypothetical protein